MMWLSIPALAADFAGGPADDGGSLPLVSPVSLEQGLYAQVDDGSFPVRPRNRRRRDADFEVWEQPNGTVVRYRTMKNGRAVSDHLFDAAGFPLVTVTLGSAGIVEKATVFGVPPSEVTLDGWLPREVPGGRLSLPDLPDDRPGGGSRVDALGGEVDIWLDALTDPFSDVFREGLVAGCGCFVVDRATAFVDGRTGVRYRLLVPGRWPRDAVDLWAIPLDNALWLMSYRVAGPEDPVTALLPGRILIALAELEDQP